MALPVGQIAFSQVNTELNLPSTSALTLNDTAVRTLAAVPTGAISMSNLQGKANEYIFTLGTTAAVNIRTAAVANGWPQTNKLVVNIPGPTNITSPATGTYAMTISGSFPQGIQVNNVGTIIGRGGNGGSLNGGPALLVQSPVSIQNTGRISGGGGGGGQGASRSIVTPIPVPLGGPITYTYGGGGAGGGIGNSSGSAGTPGSHGTGTPGGAGTLIAVGGGGSGSGSPAGPAAPGGPGGTYGSAGTNGGPGHPLGGAVAGTAGAAISGAPLITWIGPQGTVNGGQS